MKQIGYHPLIWFFGILLLMASAPAEASETEQQAYFQERANLALRDIAHQMLLIEGDSTTTVPPVRSSDGRQFFVRYAGELHYDTLRAIIDQTLQTADLPLRYDLTIYDCLDETLLLGFAARPQTIGEEYPCQERNARTRCVDIAIRFPEQNNQFIARAGWFGGFTAFFILLFTGWWRRNKSRQDTPFPVVSTDQKPLVVQIGQAVFRPQEQTIAIDGQEKKLTYREAKLLHYFTQKTNQVLPREQIMEAVWGEEGVQVTRSLDVFVSRLRKILKEDPLIEIASIHGVGYRFVVQKNTSATAGGMGFPNSVLNHFRN